MKTNKTSQSVLISLNDACVMTSLSRTFINKMRAAGEFPTAVALGEKRVAFVRSEVVEWIERRISARAGRTA
ncbi:helix-turn-helix transcriptional regulator [Agrobacterium sp. Azo12]|uniref:helix-turn-helix transcriptional regulator n=1 Tax=Agrobacterium sp. Azo12 TaxID=3031129 RepID=UPI0023D86C47|nr:AlpA family phage regulatory protein [Agrobacterium sp. Azo12]MDO5896539.1 AlpA family phage regulatory protein [Agrobacterium sp. Azo12]